MLHRITPNLWFDTQAEEAARFYCSVFDDSRVLRVLHHGEAGTGEPGSVLTVDFELDGMRFTAINGGPQFTFSEAVSFLVACKDQAEIDHFWDALLAGGGQPTQCGWLRDRYGLAWQVIPKQLDELITDPDPARANRAMKAMLGMVKLDVAALQRAADGD